MGTFFSITVDCSSGLNVARLELRKLYVMYDIIDATPCASRVLLLIIQLLLIVIVIVAPSYLVQFSCPG